jgi:hypothetical protein
MGGGLVRGERAVGAGGVEGEGAAGHREAITVLIPIRTVNPLNGREHWKARARRVRAERTATWACVTGKPRPALPCEVTMTRSAPSNGLDDDSLPASCKGVRDELARWFGVDDRDPRVKWAYAQKRGPWAVEVSIA